MEKNTAKKLAYITCANLAEAKSIGYSLVEQKLVACANILPEVTSIFQGNDKILEVSECLLIGKTIADKVGQVTKAVQTLHSYDCPCVVFLDLNEGSAEFMKWVADCLT